MYTSSQYISYIKYFLSRNDQNGLAIFEDYLKECSTAQDFQDLVDDFEKSLADEMAFEYYNKLDLYFKSFKN